MSVITESVLIIVKYVILLLYCADLSDEENCTNHMVCKNTETDRYNRKQLIALSQRSDAIYDCFDLSDECNEHCKKLILQNWALRIFCWSMGILALVFNFFTITNAVKQLKDCETGNMLMTKTFVGLIYYFHDFSRCNSHTLF